MFVGIGSVGFGKAKIGFMGFRGWFSSYNFSDSDFASGDGFLAFFGVGDRVFCCFFVKSMTRTRVFGYCSFVGFRRLFIE